jgi:hypothetical protein
MTIATSAAREWRARLGWALRLATPDTLKTARLVYSVIFGWAVPAATTHVILLRASSSRTVSDPKQCI